MSRQKQDAVAVWVLSPSRNGHIFKSWPALADQVAASVRSRSAVLDGEICSLDADGRSDFFRLMFRPDQPYFYAFDVLDVDGEDITGAELLERKQRLHTIISRTASRLLHLNAVQKRGTDFYRFACEADLEGIVAKWSRGT